MTVYDPLALAVTKRGDGADGAEQDGIRSHLRKKIAADLIQFHPRAQKLGSGEIAVDLLHSTEGLVLPYQPERNIVRVDLEPDVLVSLSNLERNFYTTSSCGICGKASLLALRTVCPPRSANCFRVTTSVLYSLPEKLRAAQNVFEKTGGLHAAGIFGTEGELYATREDVGRHNAVDKLLGGEFLADRTPLRDRLLLLSGRASFELLQKALMGGISMVVAVGAPSSLAVQVAKEFDITLVGFLRGDRFNVYHGAERILGNSELARGKI